MQINCWFDQDTFTLTYCVFDETSKDAVIIDPVWDYDPASGSLAQTSVGKVADFLRSRDLNLRYILETHAHADHITGAQPLKNKFPGAKIGIGSQIKTVQSVFSKVFNLSEDFGVDGRQFDLLLEDGEELIAGKMKIKVIATPGHTPACVSYLIHDALFTGDALFMPDSGTGRCDFPAGSASDLYDSIKRLYTLPDQTRVFPGHDYQPDGRELRWESTIGDEKSGNIQLKHQTSKEDFVSMREARDRGLKAPRLLLPSIQVNIAAGILPKPEENGRSYLKMPIKG